MRAANKSDFEQLASLRLADAEVLLENGSTMQLTMLRVMPSKAR
jgi:hypothetical protein